MAKHRIQQAGRLTAARGIIIAGAITGAIAIPTAQAAAAPPRPAPPTTSTEVPVKTPAKPVKKKAAKKVAKKKKPVGKKKKAVKKKRAVKRGIAPKVQAQSAEAKAVKLALAKQGAPYSYGAAGPDAFDCSGLVYWAMSQAGVNIPRDSWGQLGGGTPVAKADLQPGDVIIYNGGSHAALYIGDGKIVESVNYGIPVKISPVDGMDYYAARRY